MTALRPGALLLWYVHGTARRRCSTELDQVVGHQSLAGARRGAGPAPSVNAVQWSPRCHAVRAVEQVALMGCEDALDLAAASLQVKRRGDLNKSNLGISILPGSLLHHS